MSKVIQSKKEINIEDEEEANPHGV